MRKYLLSLIILLFADFSWAQPLNTGWSKLLQGKWSVEMIDTLPIDRNINMFLEFQKEKLLMHNPQQTKEVLWKCDEGLREIYILSDGNHVEAWTVRYIDTFSLAIYDTIGFNTLYLSRYDSSKAVKGVIISRSQICGSWLLVRMDNLPVPKNVNLTLDIYSDMKLNVSVADDVQSFHWKLNENHDGMAIANENGSSTKNWIVTSLDNDKMILFDEGRIMEFCRYLVPLDRSQEKLIAGKWKIVELEGSVMPVSEEFSRYIDLKSEGKLTFATGNKIEGEGTWGLNSTKNSIFILSSGGTELWNIFSINKSEMILELEGLKMLLRK